MYKSAQIESHQLSGWCNWTSSVFSWSGLYPSVVQILNSLFFTIITHLALFARQQQNCKPAKDFGSNVLRCASRFDTTIQVSFHRRELERPSKRACLAYTRLTPWFFNISLFKTHIKKYAARQRCWLLFLRRSYTLQFLGRIIAHCLQANIRVPPNPRGTNDTVPPALSKVAVLCCALGTGAPQRRLQPRPSVKKLLSLPCNSGKPCWTFWRLAETPLLSLRGTESGCQVRMTGGR